MPARYVFLDEVDAYPASADEEGDPVTLAAGQQPTQAHRRRGHTAFGQGHRTHPQPADPTRPGMGRSRRRWGGATGQQELAASRFGVHRPAHHVPHLRDLLPLVDQQGTPAPQHLLWFRGDRLADGFGVQPDHAGDPLFGGGGLPHAFGPVDGDGRHLVEQLIQLGIEDAAHILHERTIQDACFESVN